MRESFAYDLIKEEGLKEGKVLVRATYKVRDLEEIRKLLDTPMREQQGS